MSKIFFLLSFLSVSAFGKTVTIELTNDSSVTGELVKSNVGEVFVDLGFDILKIPKTSVVSMVDKQAKQSNEKPFSIMSFLLILLGKERKNPLTCLLMN